MDYFLVPVLALFTLVAVLVFAMYNRKKTQDLLDDPNSGKSSLAVDGNPHQDPEKSPGFK